MRCFLNGGMPNTARLTFDEMYRSALEAGELPPLDDTVKKLPVIDDGPWGEVLLRVAGELAAKGRTADVAHLAWQALALGEPNLAQDLMAKALPKLPDAPPAVILDAVAFLANTGKIALAQELIQPLLEHPRASQLSELWRTAADLAGRRNQSRRMVEYLDRALELEFDRMPAEFDVRGPRAEYSALLAGFQQVASAHKQLETPLSAEFVTRVVRAADRWRALDSDPTSACQAAARLLRDLDQPALAWEYLTSPVAFKPNEADPFKNLAQELSNSGDAALAEKAYAAAFAAEPTNAELLWLRVGVLRQAGKESEALKVLGQIADGDWQPRFDWIKRNARQTLGR
jgi:Tfp pilus assembly protein PilF